MNIRPFLFYLLLAFSNPATALEVLTSLRPLQLVANEIMGSDGGADYLIDPRESPHHFQLKPSQLRKLARADVVIWISDHFETGIARLREQMPPGDARLELAAVLPGELLIGTGHELDGHLWLSPVTMREIVARIAASLASHDPASARRYRENALALQQKIDNWLEQTLPRLAAAQPAYVLDHAFLAYFERDLGLASRGSLRNAHDHGGSMRHLSHLHHELDEADARCLLVERLPASRQALAIGAEHGLAIKPLSLLGEQESIHSIVDLYRQISDSLLQCSTQTPQ